MLLILWHYKCTYCIHIHVYMYIWMFCVGICYMCMYVNVLVCVCMHVRAGVCMCVFMCLGMCTSWRPAQVEAAAAATVTWFKLPSRPPRGSHPPTTSPSAAPVPSLWPGPHQVPSHLHYSLSSVWAWRLSVLVKVPTKVSQCAQNNFCTKSTLNEKRVIKKTI